MALTKKTFWTGLLWNLLFKVSTISLKFIKSYNNDTKGYIKLLVSCSISEAEQLRPMIALGQGTIQVQAWVLYTCTIGWFNFSEFEITACGSCKISTTKNKIDHFFIFFFFAKILYHLSTLPTYCSIKNKLHFRICLKTVFKLI